MSSETITHFTESGSSPPSVKDLILEWIGAIFIHAVFLAVFFLAAFAEPASSVRVMDGDTVKVGTTTVRLYGIDAPEKKQDGGLASKARLEHLVASCASMRIEARDIDRYGRTVGVITCQGRKASLNEAMVLAGAAWHYRAYASCSTSERLKGGSIDCAIASAEASARKKRIGIWASSNPQPPWEWRKAQRAGGAR